MVATWLQQSDAVWARGHEQFFLTPIDNKKNFCLFVFLPQVVYFICSLLMILKYFKKLMTQNTVEYQSLDLNGIREFDS